MRNLQMGFVSLGSKEIGDSVGDRSESDSRERNFSALLSLFSHCLLLSQTEREGADERERGRAGNRGGERERAEERERERDERERGEPSAFT